MERRTTSGIVEIRAAEEGSTSTTVSGYAAKFNKESEVLYNSFVEVIAPGAFDEVLNDDIRALFNHDPNHILARSKNGSGTLNLSIDGTGLKYEFRANTNTTAGADLVENIRAGNIDQSSFAFTIASGGETWTTEERDGKEIEVRTISKIDRLFDVSPVTYPAYPSASVGLRSLKKYQEGKEEKEKPKGEANEVEKRRLELLRLRQGQEEKNNTRNKIK